MSEKKICDCCKEELSIDDFRLRKDKRIKLIYRLNICKQCERNKYHTWKTSIIQNVNKRNGEKGFIKSNGVINSLFLTDLYEKQNGLCYWFNIPLDLTRKNGLLTPSLDRLDNNKGYSHDNVVLTSRFANLGRNVCDKEKFRDFINNLIE